MTDATKSSDTFVLALIQRFFDTVDPAERSALDALLSFYEDRHYATEES